MIRFLPLLLLLLTSSCRTFGNGAIQVNTHVTTEALSLPITFIHSPQVIGVYQAMAYQVKTPIQKVRFSGIYIKGHLLRWSHYDWMIQVLEILNHEPYSTAGHVERTAEIMDYFVSYLGFSLRETATLNTVAYLHDLGKLCIPKSIFRKPGKLTPREYEIMKKHVFFGAWFVSLFKNGRPLAALILAHHERYDGKGYPYGIQGRQIPRGARVLAIVDTFDAMTQNRVYRLMRPTREAIAEIARCAGTQFDPYYAQMFVRMFAENHRGIIGYLRRSA